MNTVVSRHYANHRKNREERIKSIGGDGEVVLNVNYFDKKRQKYFRYEVTENAIVRIYPTDRDYLITKYFCNTKLMSYLFQSIGENPPHWLLTEARRNENLNY